jgi:hypothetical protein
MPGVVILMYENFKHGSQLLFDKLGTLFNAIIKYAKIPQLFKLGLLIPLYKGKRKPKSQKGSYRGVTLMPVINKLLEKIVWLRLEPWLKSRMPHD